MLVYLAAALVVCSQFGGITKLLEVYLELLFCFTPPVPANGYSVVTIQQLATFFLAV